MVLVGAGQGRKEAALACFLKPQNWPLDAKKPGGKLSQEPRGCNTGGRRCGREQI